LVSSSFVRLPALAQRAHRSSRTVRKPFRGAEHQVTIPAHSPLKVGTLSGILLEIATYLEISKDVLARELFG